MFSPPPPKLTALSDIQERATHVINQSYAQWQVTGDLFFIVSAYRDARDASLPIPGWVADFFDRLWRRLLVFRAAPPGKIQTALITALEYQPPRDRKGKTRKRTSKKPGSYN